MFARGRRVVPSLAAMLALGACTADTSNDRDSTVGIDAAQHSDAATGADAANESDVGAQPDAGSRTDSATSEDAGPRGDAGGPLPDLIVVDVTWSPASPVQGDAVTFSATIKNQGTAATPGGVIHGVAFSVDGVGRTWTDNDTASLAAGDSLTLTANGGPSGAAWNAVAGTHAILAFVDDLNRIVESDETNNQMTKSLTVTSSGPRCGDGICNGTETAVSCPGDCAFCATGYNVRDPVYGAKADGSANDAPAIQKAINAAHKAGSGTVCFPSSSDCYLIGDALMFYSGIDYVGQSPGVCIKVKGTQTFTMVDTDSTAGFQNSRIANLTFDGNCTIPDKYDCLSLRGPTNVRIESVTAKNCAEDGFYITGYGANRATEGDGLLITNCVASANGRNGMSIVAGKNIAVRDSEFSHQNSVGPYFDGGVPPGPYDGVDIEPNSGQEVEHLTFERCKFLNNGSTAEPNIPGHTGLNVWSEYGSLLNLDLRLVDCVFNGNRRDGLYAAASADCSPCKLADIYLLGGSMDGNLATSSYRGGADIWNTDNVVVSNISITSSANTTSSQAVVLAIVNGAKVASSTLSGKYLDLNVDGKSSNVQVYDSTAFDPSHSKGSYSRPTGEAPHITRTPLPPAKVGKLYSQPLAPSGTPITWTLDVFKLDSGLPQGFTLGSDGLLSGTPGAAGTYVFTVKATNSALDLFDLTTLELTVNP